MKIHNLVFVTSFAFYNEALKEDTSKNALLESLDLFENTIKNSIFQNSVITLILNKHDIFYQRVKDEPITSLFPEYKGSNEEQQAAHYIYQKFLERNDNNQRQIHMHFVSSTDKNNVEKIFNDMRHVTINNEQLHGGLL